MAKSCVLADLTVVKCLNIDIVLVDVPSVWAFVSHVYTVFVSRHGLAFLSCDKVVLTG